MWRLITPRGVGGNLTTAVAVGVADMSLIKNLAGQNIEFAVLNATDGSPLTGATISSFITKDGGAQAAAAGTFTELTPTGLAVYSYALTQPETNANAIGVMVTAPNAVPFNMIFLTGGLHKNVASQNISFGMVSQASVGDPSATVTTKVSINGGSLSTGAGTVTNLGNFQYNYAIPQAETNGDRIGYFFSASGDITQAIFIFTVP
jgi:hypothetical protein